VRVFGGWSWIEGRPWQSVQYGVAKKRDVAIRRQAIPAIDTGLRHAKRISGQRRQHREFGLAMTRAATIDLN